MDPILSQFVIKHRKLDQNEHYTHVSAIRPRGRFCFEQKNMEELWETYSERLQSNPDMVSGLAEMPREYSMLVVDADLKRKVSEVEKDYPESKVSYLDGDQVRYKNLPVKLYTYAHIEKLVLVYQNIVKAVTKDWNPNHSICILLEKDPYIKDDSNKSGFHLAFLYYFCNRDMSNTYLIPRVITKVDELKIFDDLRLEVSTAEKILDIDKRGSSAKPWLLFGSRKGEGQGSYRVAKAYGHNAEEIDFGFLRQYEIFDGREQPIRLEKPIEFYYPRIFSVNPSFRDVAEIVPFFESTENMSFSEEKEPRPELKDESIDQQLKKAGLLLPMLSLERVTDRNDWIQVGWILYSISRGSEDGLKLWIEFSKRAPQKFNLQLVVREWSRMYVGSATMGSLVHFAKIDSPEEYEAYREKNLTSTIRKAVDGSHYDLAFALYESYSTEFVCASLTPEIWYYYRDHHWQEMQKGIELRKKISIDLVAKYKELIKGEFDNLGEDDKKTQGRIASIFKLIKSLGNTTFKNNIMKEATELFYDPTFMKKLGRDKHLLALKNGVYDLCNHLFREGRPEDCLYFQMPISYEEISELDPGLIEVHSFFEKIFPDASVREYFIDRLAEMLVGGNKRKHLYFWAGRGNGGKSVTKLLVQRMFGQYYIDLPNSVLVGDKPKSGQACPELDRARQGIRCAMTQEPARKDKLNTASCKEYTGNDSFYVRTLYDKGNDLTPLFKLVMITNDLPQVTVNDHAFWNRVRIIPFESLFSYDYPPDESEQMRLKIFPRDDNFDSKIDSMIGPLFWMLTKRLPHIGRTIVEPKKVLEACEKYRVDQDIYGQYISEKLIIDDRCSISLPALYFSFREWHKLSFPGALIPGKNDLRDHFLDIWNDPVNEKWAGYRIREHKDDVKDGTAEECSGVSYDDAQDNPLKI